MVKSKERGKHLLATAFVILILILATSGIGYYFFNSDANEAGGGFEVDRLFIRTVLKENGSTNSFINLLNNDINSQEFSIKINEISDLISISESNIFILCS